MEGADLSQICLKENGDREESEVSVVQVRKTQCSLSKAFIKQGEAEHLGALLVSKPKEAQGNDRISTASRNPTSIPLFSHNNYFYSFLQFKGGGFTAAAQLVLNFLENISPNTHSYVQAQIGNCSNV